MIATVVAALADLAQVTDPDYLDDAGRIIGSPDPGPDPTHSGDRGGVLQFVLFFGLVGGVSFIAWRIRTAMRQARRVEEG
ncbi:MAG: hypothetical protein ACO3PD_01670 [Acidimicrobiales bacterium]|jgi:hypothetical protein